MEPRDAEEDREPAGSSSTPTSDRKRKRGLLFGGVGAAVAVALVVVVLIVTGGSGQPTNTAARAKSTTKPELSVTLGTTSPTAEPVQPPGTVRLPDGSTATLVKRGLTEDNTLPIPKDLDKAAWWGAGLGESGAMLLSGHVNWNGEAGPFKELLNIQPGQNVTVLDNSGAKWVYQVREVHKVSKKKLPSVAPELFSQDGKHRLVLVTCGGEFIGGQTGYASNIIAIADLVSSPQ